jgi:electron transfer flavoprotein beta subunit
MHFVCCIKQVPDTAEVKIDPETNTLVRAGVESISNPYDIVALEEAVRLKEHYGGRVTAVTMGPPQAESCLREALSLGADEAILLSDRAFAGADTLATSYTLSRAIERLDRELPVDLVLCGKQAIDGDTAQTGPGIATRLGYTQLTYVIDVEWVDPSERKIQVRRKLEEGVEIILGRLPAMISVELELAEPRRAPLSLMIHSLRAPIKVWDAAAIEAAAPSIGIKGSPTWVKRIASPPVREGGPRFDGEKDAAEAVERCLDLLFSDAAFSSKFLRKWEA